MLDFGTDQLFLRIRGFYTKSFPQQKMIDRPQLPGVFGGGGCPRLCAPAKTITIIDVAPYLATKYCIIVSLM